MDDKKALLAGALVAGGAVTLCCVAPLGLIPLALIAVAGGLRDKLKRTKAADGPPESIADATSLEISQPGMKVTHE